MSWGEPTFDRLVGSEPETADLAVQRQPLDAAQRDRPPGRPVRGDAPPAHRQPRDARDPAPAHPPGDRDLPRRCSPAASSSGSTSPTPTAARSGSPSTCRPNFALNQPLSPFALAALELLDRESPTYALDVVSVIESTLDDPRQVLSAQQNKARGEAVAAMKAEGIEYEERMELLEEVTYPQPLAELLDAAFEIYRAGHPWVADYELLAQVGRARHVRARDDLRRVRRLLRARPLRGPRAALPRRRLPGAAADRARTPRAPRSSTTSSSGSASSSARSTPACSTSGSSCAPAPTTAEPARGAACRRRRRASPPTSAPSACSCATRCSAGCELAARRDWRRPRRARRRRRLGRRRWRDALEPYFDEHDDIGTGAGRPRPARCSSSSEQPGALDGPADPRRPGRRPRLGHHRRRRPRRLRRGRRGGAHHHRRRAALTTGGAVPQQV